MSSFKKSLKKVYKPILKSNFMISLGAALIAFYIRLIYRTVKWEIRNYEVLENLKGNPSLICFWHGRLLMVPAFNPPETKGNVMISKHSDGEIIARAMRYFDINSLRGSASDGGYSAIKGIMKLVRKGETVAITPDGPRGPARKAKKAVTQLAKNLDIPLIPVTFTCTNHRKAKSWDSFMIAKPFGRGIFAVGEPIPPSQADTLEDALNKLTDEVDLAAESL